LIYFDSYFYYFYFLEIFYENGALEEFIRLFNNEACPDHQHVLETILTLSSIKPNTLSTLAERDQVLSEQFEQKLNERRQLIQSSEDQQVSYFNKEIFSTEFYYLIFFFRMK
jgi:hypothetical protein